MRKLVIYLLSAAGLILSCDDDRGQESHVQCCENKDGTKNFFVLPGQASPIPGDYWCVNRNGICWSAYSAASYLEDSDTLLIYGSKGEEHLTIKFKFDGVGSYDLTGSGKYTFYGNNATYYVTVGQDVLINHYHPEGMGQLMITYYDKVENVIEGTFDLTMRSQPEYTDGPEVIDFTDGKFRIHIRE